jgi:hypothetical protein
MHQQRWRQIAQTSGRIGAAQQQQFAISREDGSAPVSRNDGRSVWQNNARCSH